MSDFLTVFVVSLYSSLLFNQRVNLCNIQGELIYFVAYPLQNMFAVKCGDHAGTLRAYVRAKTAGIVLGFRQFPAVDLEKFCRMYLIYIPCKVYMPAESPHDPRIFPQTYFVRDLLQFPTLDLHDPYSFSQFPTSSLQ